MWGQASQSNLRSVSTLKYVTEKLLAILTSLGGKSKWAKSKQKGVWSRFCETAGFKTNVYFKVALIEYHLFMQKCMT